MTLRRRQEKRHFRGKVADPGTRFLGRGQPGRREQPAHEPLSSRATLVKVPLTGLSFSREADGFRSHARRRVNPVLPQSRTRLLTISHQAA